MIEGMSAASASSTPAPRFTLSLPMRYRVVGQSAWKVSKTVNVSASGLLFLTDDRFPHGTKLEVEVSMTSSMLKPTHLTTVSEVLRQRASGESLVTTVHYLSSQTVEGDFLS